MKSLKFLIVIIILLFSTTLAQEGWFWQNPQPQGNSR